MSIHITEAFSKAFSENVYMLLQDKGSVLRQICRIEPFRGDTMYIERIGQSEAYIKYERHGDTRYVNTPHSSRRITCVPLQWVDLIDEDDKLRTLIDPTSPYVENAVYALGRALDTIIVNAIFGNAYSKNSDTAISPTGCRVIKADGTVPAVGSHLTGSTEAILSSTMLLTAKTLLDKNHVYRDRRRFVVCTSDAINQLLQDTKMTSADYNSVRALQAGTLNEFMGFTFVVTNRLNTLGGTEYSPVYPIDSGTADAGEVHWAVVAEGAVALGLQRDITTSIDKLPTKNYSTQVFASMMAGAVRLEEEAVVLGLHKAG